VTAAQATPPPALTVERMDAELAAALLLAQGEVEAALKLSFNNFHKYKYASAEDILAVGREALQKAGLVMIPITEDFSPLDTIDDRMGGAVALVRARYRVLHKNGAFFDFTTDVPVVPEKGKASGWSRPADKAAFGSRTEALGYALRDLLLIPREDAPDVSGRETDGPRTGPGPAEQPPAANIEELLEAMREAPELSDMVKVLSRRNQLKASELPQLEAVFAERVEDGLAKMTRVEALGPVEAYLARIKLDEAPRARIAQGISLAKKRLGGGAP
jgi:hypothetical protein